MAQPYERAAYHCTYCRACVLSAVPSVLVLAVLSLRLRSNSSRLAVFPRRGGTGVADYARRRGADARDRRGSHEADDMEKHTDREALEGRFHRAG